MSKTLKTFEGKNEYWKNMWADRIKGAKGGYDVKMNIDKMEIVISYLLHCKKVFDNADILDVGCGTGIHFDFLKDNVKHNSYKGVDLSQSAVEHANKYFDLDIELISFFDLPEDKKYNVFLFLDSFEHFESNPPLIDKINKLKADNFTVIMNVPLYSSVHSKCERVVSNEIISDFYYNIGVKDFMYAPYFIRMWPYVLLEGGVS